jgi:ubiquinone/menaquinone biosynthesis C-methylase UbiE
MGVALVAGFFLLVLGILYWELWICEGAHLGKRFVAWTYDLAANRYEQIKDFDWDWEKRFLGEPLARTLGTLEAAYLLDVGAGTGRLARSLQLALSQMLEPSDPDQNIPSEFRTPFEKHLSKDPETPDPDRITGLDQPSLPGLLVCLEPSRRMVEIGLQTTPGWACWLNAWGFPLPFPAASFDVITCLEVLEFTPDPIEILDEIQRVLRPGGWLLLSNRRGVEAKLILGKTQTLDAMSHTLRSMEFDQVQAYPWQMDYDLLWARKNWVSAKS